MKEPDWSDPRIPKAFFKAPSPPTPFQTEAFVSRVMARLESQRRVLSPLLEWFTGRWTVPALGLGIVAVALAIFYTSPRGALVLRPSLTGSDTQASWVIALDEDL